VIRVQQQHREQGTLLAPAERQRAAMLDHLQRAKKPKLHCSVSAGPS
jgi:hypothetical protein